VTQGINPEVFANPVKTYAEYSPYTRSMVLSLHTTILANPIKEILESYPSDWWEHFKQRWFPSWLIRRFPVREEVIWIKVADLYPSIAIPPHQSYRYATVRKHQTTR
jgi:hypothetical protein